MVVPTLTLRKAGVKTFPPLPPTQIVLGGGPEGGGGGGGGEEEPPPPQLRAAAPKIKVPISPRSIGLLLGVPNGLCIKMLH